MSKTALLYRFVGVHPDTLSDGTTMEPGQFYELEPDELRDLHNADLLDSGRLLSVDLAQSSGTKHHKAATRRAARVVQEAQAAVEDVVDDVPPAAAPPSEPEPPKKPTTKGGS